MRLTAMASRGGNPDRDAPAGRSAALSRWASGRSLYLDDLKVILVAAVIGGHALIGYSAFDWWSYSDVREVTLSPVTVGVLMAVAVPFGMIVIPLLFLIAGLLTPPSLRRHGVAGYARSRLLRLGVPFAVFALLLWPYLEYALFRLAGHVDVSYPAYLRVVGTLDTGVLWFIGALLMFSLAYAAGVTIGRGRRWPGPGEARARDLLTLTAAVVVVTFLLRLVLPYETDSPYIDVNLWEWPLCAALFGLGVAMSRHGWATTVPDRLRRRCRAVTLAAAVAAGTFLGVVLATGITEDQLAGGWRWPALLFVAGETVIAVFGPVWLLAAAQTHLGRRPRRWGPAVARSAYGAFMVQGLVLFALAVTLRAAPAPAEVKALVVAVAGIAGSYGLSWLLISRVPLAARLL
ncbi:acyltransferase [Actinoplanes sp. NPDC023714]|uniref:acyltransferase family protein n=1 Tax=Actinoplanes sp. NPDC023714 TaxID=3154322 RepID=UPI0033E930CA